MTDVNNKLEDEFDYYKGWQTTFSIQTLKHSNEFETECWTLYNPVTCKKSGILERERLGVKYRYFPAYNIFSFFISFTLLKYLLLKNLYSEKYIIHMQALHTPMSNLISFFSRNIPLIAQQRSPNFPPIIKYRRTGRLVYFLHQFIDKFCLRFYDHIFAPSVAEYIYLKKIINQKNITFLKGGGFDFDENPKLDKLKSREDLGLPHDKKILIHVGRYNNRKGLPLIIDTYEKIKINHKNLMFIIIGGDGRGYSKSSINSKIYDKAMNSSSLVIDKHLPKVEVIKYLSAADLNIMCSEDNTFNKFSDISNVEIEAAAMGTPSVSSFLLHYYGTKEERNKLGIFTTSENLGKSLNRFIEAEWTPGNTRKLIKKYYNWKFILTRNFTVYKDLTRKYYGNLKFE